MSSKRDHRSADTWLHALHLQLRPLFKRHGYKLPPYFQFHVGWPKGRSALAEIHIGGQKEHRYDPEHPFTVFIRPTIDKPLEVAESLVHELIHAVLPPTLKGHPRAFQDACRRLGLVMTHMNGHTEIDTGEHRWHNHPRRGAGTDVSEAPPGSPQGRALLKLLSEITTDLGPYPHKAIRERVPAVRDDGNSKKWVKFGCPACKAYVLRIGHSALWIEDAYCPPLCGNSKCDNYGGECEER
jgi:hypothetical protein